MFPLNYQVLNFPVKKLLPCLLLPVLLFSQLRLFSHHCPGDWLGFINCTVSTAKTQKCCFEEEVLLGTVTLLLAEFLGSRFILPETFSFKKIILTRIFFLWLITNVLLEISNRMTSSLIHVWYYLGKILIFLWKECAGLSAKWCPQELNNLERLITAWYFFANICWKAVDILSLVWTRRMNRSRTSTSWQLRTWCFTWIQLFHRHPAEGSIEWCPWQGGTCKRKKNGGRLFYFTAQEVGLRYPTNVWFFRSTKKICLWVFETNHGNFLATLPSFRDIFFTAQHCSVLF